MKFVKLNENELKIFCDFCLNSETIQRSNIVFPPKWGVFEKHGSENQEADCLVLCDNCRKLLKMR